MAKAKRVTMRHPVLSKNRKTDVTVEVREDQVAIHQESGWQVVTPAAEPKKEAQA